MHRLTGVDLLAVPGINHISALQLIGEISLDMTQWKSAKQFASWLGLCPGNKVSGGKRLSGKTKKTSLRVLNEDESLGRSLNLELEGDYHPKGLVTRDRFSSPLIDRLPLSC